MDLIIVFGPPAAGKMTVGQELSRLTGFPLLHNHMTVDLVRHFFDFDTPEYDRLVPAFRQMLVTEAAASDLPGLIFTFVWDLDLDNDRRFMDGLQGVVAAQGGATYYAELQADLEERVARNGTENRLRHKRINPVSSEAFLRSAEGVHRMNSRGDFPYPDHHVKIDNTHLSVEEAALRIIAAFSLPVAEKTAEETRA